MDKNSNASPEVFGFDFQVNAMHKMYVKNYTKKERNGKCFMDFLSYFSFTTMLLFY